MLLHVHKERVDSLQLECVANDFVRESEHRLKIFGVSVTMFLFQLMLSLLQTMLNFTMNLRR